MGWNGSDKVAERAASSFKKKESPKSTRKLRVVLAILLPIVICLIAGYFIFSKADDNAAKSNIGQEKSKVTKRYIKPSAKVELPKTIASNSVTKVEPHKVTEPVVLSVKTNANGSVVTRLKMPDGSTRRSIKSPPPIWDNAADQLIAFAISIEPGVEAPPLPSGITNDEFRRALKKDIVIKPDDSEQVKDIKRRVRETRREILETMEATGKSFEQVLNEHRAQMNQNSALYHEAVKGLKEVEQNGTPEEVAEYIEKSNELLRSQGARELPVRNSQNQNENIEERR